MMPEKATRPGLSRSEMEVARVLWELKKASVREVHEALLAHRKPSQRDVDFSTVQTWLRRLEQKGYAKTTLSGRLRIYSPRVKPVTVIRETVDDLIDKLFGGNAMPLMRHLIKDGRVSDAEIEQLKTLIDDVEACDEGGEA